MSKRRDELGDEEPTVVDGSWEEFPTPVDPPQCPECGAVAALDDFDARSLASFPADYCSRAADGHWYCCVNYSPTHVKVVNYYPRKR